MTFPEPLRHRIGEISMNLRSARFRHPALVFLVLMCAVQRCASVSASSQARTTPVQLMDENTYLLLEVASDRSYAFRPSNPVKVGSSDGNGPLNERRYLNALAGPGGERIEYFRAGSCCPFKTPNGIVDNTGMLDRYRVFWEGSKDTLDIYINMYDEGDLKIPAGLTAKRKG